MVHIHKKIRHHVTKHKSHFITFAALFGMAIILSGAFLITRGANPSVSELAFTERSSFSAGSIIPASCESGYDHSITKTCWDGSVISDCGTCPLPPTCPSGYSGVYPDCVPPPCPSGYSGIYPYCTPPPPSGCGDGTLNDTCACPAGYTGTYPNCVPPSPEITCTTTNYDYTELQADGCTVKSWSSDNIVCSNNTSLWLQGPFSYDTSGCAAPKCQPGETGTYPNCVAPPPVVTCTDPNANNYGASGSCTYDPVLTAKLSQSKKETLPGVSWTLTWDSILAYSCTVTYTGPDGGGTIIAPGTTTESRRASKSGSKVMTLTPLGSYTFTNICTDRSKTDSRSITHLVVYPDLTASAVTPTSVMVNTNKTFSSTISNIGTADTVLSFRNLLQLATGPNGTGTVTDIASTTMGHLRGGRTSREDFSYRFTSTGTYYLRVCADKSSMGDATGAIDETGVAAGENNNCGPWTAITVNNGECALPWGGWLPNGSTTIAYNRATVVEGDRCDRYDQNRRCDDGVLNGSYPYGSCGPAVPLVIGFGVSPRTVERGGLVKINWSIENPTASCKISAAVQIPTVCDATCLSNRAAASSTLNTILSAGTTNSNDPYGASREMTDALTTPVDGYAKGEKSVTLDYSTTFTLTCGAAANTVKNLIYVTDRTEG